MACPSKHTASYSKEIKYEWSLCTCIFIEFILYLKKSHQYHFSLPSPLRSKKSAVPLVLEGSQCGPQTSSNSVTWELATNAFPGLAPDLMHQKFWSLGFWVSKSSSGDSDPPSSWRTTTLRKGLVLKAYSLSLEVDIILDGISEFAYHLPGRPMKSDRLRAPGFIMSH